MKQKELLMDLCGDINSSFVLSPIDFWKCVCYNAVRQKDIVSP